MAGIAKIIGEAGIRLRADQRGLAAELRATLKTALKEATTGLTLDLSSPVEKDANRTASRVRAIFSELFSRSRGLITQFNQAVAAGTKLTLIGAAAGVGLAGISSLITGVIGLIGVLAQASGALGLLPAAFLAVKAATATVKIGLENVGESFSALASGDAEAFAESLKKLAPQARAFVVEVAKVKPAFDQMKLGVQNELFAGLSKSVAGLANRYLPLINDLFRGMAVEINAAAKEAVKFFDTGEVAGQLGILISNIKRGFHQLVPAVQPVLSAFLDISQVGSEFLPRIAKGFAGVSQQFAEFIREAAASGRLEQFFENSLTAIKQLGQVLVQLGGGFAAIFNAAQAAGGGFLAGLLEITTAFNKFTSSAQGQSALIEFFTAMRGIIAQVIPVIVTIAKVLASTVAPIFADLARIILPVLNSVIQQFGAALAAARPGITALAQGIATMLEVFGPTITFAVQLAGILGGVLGKVLQTLAPVLARVANAILNGLMAVMPKLEPIIIAIVEAFVQLIDAAIPLIPLFFEIITALLPILPPLLQLVAAILPSLILLVQALIPIIQAFAQILLALIPPITSLVTTILNILIPPIQLIAAVVAQVAQIVADVFSAMSGTVTGILTALGAIISGIWGTITAIFTGAVNIIGGFVRGAFEGMRSTIAGILGGISSTVSTAIDDIVGFFRELPGKVLRILSDLAGDAVQAGEDIIRGIVRGLGNIAGQIVAKLRSIVSDAWDSVTSFFGIFSPSRRAIEDFMQVGRGAIIGLQRIAPQVNAAAAEMAAGAMESLRGPLTAGATFGGLSGAAGTPTAGGLAGGVVLNQTNIMQPGADVQQFAAEVSRRGAQKLASGSTSLPVSVGSVQSGMAPPGSLTGVGGI